MLSDSNARQFLVLSSGIKEKKKLGEISRRCDGLGHKVRSSKNRLFGKKISAVYQKVAKYMAITFKALAEETSF